MCVDTQQRVSHCKYPGKEEGGEGKGRGHLNVSSTVDSGYLTITQPATVLCKMEARLEHARVASTFFARLAPICPAQSTLTDENFCVRAQEKVY